MDDITWQAAGGLPLQKEDNISDTFTLSNQSISQRSAKTYPLANCLKTEPVVD